eukprot:scaffold14848_cov79-Skeletonema_marinoi.AAC.3
MRPPRVPCTTPMHTTAYVNEDDTFIAVDEDIRCEMRDARKTSSSMLQVQAAHQPHKLSNCSFGMVVEFFAPKYAASYVEEDDISWESRCQWGVKVILIRLQ